MAPVSGFGKSNFQKLADELGLTVVVLHLPLGTSKWNKIEHRLFSFIPRNWRGRPLIDYRTIVELVGATTSNAGLTVRCELDKNSYPAGINVSDAEMAARASSSCDRRSLFRNLSVTTLRYRQSAEMDPSALHHNRDACGNVAVLGRFRRCPSSSGFG